MTIVIWWSKYFIVQATGAIFVYTPYSLSTAYCLVYYSYLYVALAESFIVKAPWFGKFTLSWLAYVIINPNQEHEL